VGGELKPLVEGLEATGLRCLSNKGSCIMSTVQFGELKVYVAGLQFLRIVNCAVFVNFLVTVFSYYYS